ncbi:hypothetical protein ACFWPX_00325 [Nocardia sp. NPDC058518]|uniref:hypothetical protein n=1 Tax=Nocardia sp. NPDC058518 TaxID=3346534 RepID=UPI0036617BBC
MTRIPVGLSRYRLPDPAALRRGLRATPAATWVLAGSGWVTLLAVHVISPDSPLSVLRTLVTFAFVLLCPGLAVARLLPLREDIEVWVVGIALSMSFGLLVTVAFTAARNDSTTSRLVSLAVITTAAAAVQIFRSARP